MNKKTMLIATVLFGLMSGITIQAANHLGNDSCFDECAKQYPDKNSTGFTDCIKDCVSGKPIKTK